MRYLAAMMALALLATACGGGASADVAADTFSIECPDGTKHAVLSADYNGSESAAVLDLCTETATPVEATTTSTISAPTTTAESTTTTVLDEIPPAGSLSMAAWLDKYSSSDMSPFLEDTLEILAVLSGGVIVFECPSMLDEYVATWGPDGGDIMNKFRVGPPELVEAGTDLVAGTTEALTACGNGKQALMQAGVDRLTLGTGQLNLLVQAELDSRNG